jgi:hypothetical protein
VALLNTATALSPDFAAAHARLSACRTQAAYYSWDGPSDASVSEALRLSRQSIAVDAEEPLAFDALASAHQFLNDVEKAEQAARRAIEPFPACTAAVWDTDNSVGIPRPYGGSPRVLCSERKKEPARYRSIRATNGSRFRIFVAKRHEETISAGEQYISLRPNWFSDGGDAGPNGTHARSKPSQGSSAAVDTPLRFAANSEWADPQAA